MADDQKTAVPSIRDRAHELGLHVEDGPIAPGDIYLAERNTGPKLLTCLRNEGTYIVPVEVAYAFEVWDCVKVSGT